MWYVSFREGLTSFGNFESSPHVPTFSAFFVPVPQSKTRGRGGAPRSVPGQATHPMRDRRSMDLCRGSVSGRLIKQFNLILQSCAKSNEGIIYNFQHLKFWISATHVQGKPGSLDPSKGLPTWMAKIMVPQSNLSTVGTSGRFWLVPPFEWWQTQEISKLVHDVIMLDTISDMGCWFWCYLLDFFEPSSSWWFQPLWKVSVQMVIFPNFRGQNKKIFELPPPSHIRSHFTNSSLTLLSRDVCLEVWNSSSKARILQGLC